MDDWTDRQIFNAVKQGNSDALSVMFKKFYLPLKHYGIYVSHDLVLSEECIQELFIYLFESHTRLGDIHSVKAYLFIGLRRRLITKLKQRRTRLQNDSDGVCRVDIQFSQEDIQYQEEENQMSQLALTSALNNLPYRQREAIYLKYYNNLSTKEIADVMGVANQTILNTLYQGLKRIRKDDSLNQLLHK